MRFEIDDSVPPARNVLHATLEHLRGVTVQASSVEEAELWADQIRLALIADADRSDF